MGIQRDGPLQVVDGCSIHGRPESIKRSKVRLVATSKEKSLTFRKTVAIVINKGQLVFQEPVVISFYQLFQQLTGLRPKGERPHRINVSPVDGLAAQTGNP